MSLLVVGSVAFDDVETPLGRRERALGGSATYFSLSASQSSEIRIVAVVGEDFGERELGVFRGRPIDLEGLERKAGASFHWKGAYAWDFNEAKTLETHLNVFADFHPKLPEAYRHSPYLFLGNIAPELQLDVVRQMAERPRWIALDTMNYWISGSREALEEVLREVDILLVNDGEARALTGERQNAMAYQRIREMGPRILVIKHGEFGVSLFTPDGVFAAPAFPLEEVVDPTGAGDTFAGGFLGFLARIGRMDFPALKHATLAGTIMASFTVERFSTERLETVTPSDIQKRLSLFSDMIRVEAL